MIIFLILLSVLAFAALLSVYGWWAFIAWTGAALFMWSFMALPLWGRKRNPFKPDPSHGHRPRNNPQPWRLSSSYNMRDSSKHNQPKSSRVFYLPERMA